MSDAIDTLQEGMLMFLNAATSHTERKDVADIVEAIANLSDKIRAHLDEEMRAIREKQAERQRAIERYRALVSGVGTGE